MVVFTCNNCGDSLQKPKVAKHYQFQCRNNISLTCVDCFKDFFGDEYVVHTKCITENERYGGKDYKPKPSANKGEKKQQAWINVVQNVLTNSKNLSQAERSFLQSISHHENIPRKKAKFLNFVKNIGSYRLNINVVESCWEKMESAFKEATEQNKSEPSKTNGKTEETPEDMKKEKSEENNIAENENNENISRETEESLGDKENTATNKKQKKKKAKKRELEEIENSNDKNDEPVAKKKTPDITEVIGETENSEGTKKFCWKSTILQVFGEKDEMSLKKMKKKVIANYLNYAGENVTREKAISRFEKKIKKITELVVIDDKVKRA